MRELAALQSEFTTALLAGRLSDLAHAFTANDKDAGRRLNIFRNNTLISLTGALKSNFPVTMRMVDERFFAYAADAFIAAHPPREPRLAVYGAKFPRFLACFPASRAYPMIAEMASFEWAIVKAMIAAEHGPAPVELLQRLDSGEGSPYIALQPNLFFAVSHWPIHEIWTAHRSEKIEAIPSFDRRATRVAVYRRHGRIRFLEIAPARFAFWRELAKGSSLEGAVTRALHRDPLFNLVDELVMLFRSGLVTRVSTQSGHARSKEHRRDG
jgi:hypothetical protein